MRRRDFFKKAGIGSAALVSLPAFADALTRSAFARVITEKGPGATRRHVRHSVAGHLLHQWCVVPTLDYYRWTSVTVRTAQ